MHRRWIDGGYNFIQNDINFECGSYGYSVVLDPIHNNN